MCLTIDYAHGRGVIHRDLEPANTMLGDFGELYVLDWGLARIVDERAPAIPEDAARLSLPGELMGTPLHMAPEQMHDPAVGVFSLGAILFEIGVLPSSYAFEHGLWVIRPQAVALSANTQWFITVMNVARIVVPCIFIAKLRDDLSHGGAPPRAGVALPPARAEGAMIAPCRPAEVAMTRWTSW